MQNVSKNSEKGRNPRATKQKQNAKPNKPKRSHKNTPKPALLPLMPGSVEKRVHSTIRTATHPTKPTNGEKPTYMTSATVLADASLSSNQDPSETGEIIALFSRGNTPTERLGTPAVSHTPTKTSTAAHAKKITRFWVRG